MEKTTPYPEFIVFTDGGAFSRPLGEGFDAASTFLLFHHLSDTPINESKLYDSYGKVTEERTNGFAEMEPIAIALERLFSHISQSPESERNRTTIQLITDSRNCYMTLTTWIYSWLKNGNGIDTPILNSRGKTPENLDVIMRAFLAKTRLMELGVAVNFYHINSHTAKKKIKQTHLKFEQENNCNVTPVEFAFIYTANKACDDAVKIIFNEYRATGQTEFPNMIRTITEMQQV